MIDENSTPRFNKIETPEGDRHPYLKKSWWLDESNYWWRNPRINYSQEFIEKQEAFARAVKSLSNGCYLRLIPDE
ncbi:MAG: hypothetical protein HRU26_10135 [Psychroserpens sp.]|nr:hypothetical protein [Psychroserpens sp.]